MSGPQIRLCLFTFRPIASKLFNSLTTIDTLSLLGGAVVTHPLWVREVPGSIPGYGKCFYIINGRDFQRKNVVKSVDKSNLWAL